jgi:hypothetical protein
MVTKLTHTQKAILDEPTKALMEAGFLSTDLKITDNCRYYMEYLDFMEKKTKIIARAKEIVAENAKKVKTVVVNCEQEADNED